MIAPRLMPRTEWSERLERMGCKRLEDDAAEPRLETGEWWLTDHEFLFPVACDPQGNLRIDDWQQVLILIARLRPLDLDT